jgi:DNA-binding CsgD family transcriptional regulator
MSSNKEDPQLSDISKKLGTLIRLSALDLVREMKTQREQIGLLSEAGLQPKEIADILKISRIQVNTVIYQIRKGKDQTEGLEMVPEGATGAQKEQKDATGTPEENVER